MYIFTDRLTHYCAIQQAGNQARGTPKNHTRNMCKKQLGVTRRVEALRSTERSETPLNIYQSTHHNPENMNL